MRKLLRYIFISATIIVLFIIGCEFTLRKIPNDYNYKAKYLKEKGSEIETLILGSSHTFYGLNPSKFTSNTFNAGHSSQSLDLDVLIFEKYSGNMTSLENVIIPISYFSYPFTLNEGKSLDKITNYNIYYGINTSNNELKYNYEIFSKPLEKNKEIIKDYFNKKNLLTIYENGYIKKRGIEKTPINDYKAAVKRHTFDINDSSVKLKMINNIRSLEKIIKSCQANNINVYLLSTPTSSTYYNAMNQNQFNNWKTTTNKLIIKYRNIKWINYLENSNDFKQEDFRDSDHLSNKGAIKLSIKVDSIINKKPLN